MSSFKMAALVLLVLIAGIIMGKIRKPATLFTTAVIIGGGIGNLIDRVYRGYVIDYIDFRVINFAVFIFADICVTCGTAVLLVILFVEMLREGKNPEQAAIGKKN